MFIDKVRIYVEGGRGGNGCLSFRREKYVPYGGPDGGNGGKGGDVYLLAVPWMKTLYDFVLRPHYKASDGEHGKGKNMHGENGEDLIIKVPCGTVVYKIKETVSGGVEKQLITDLKNPDDKILVSRGGMGGRGNAAFKSSTNRAPRIAELGEKGEKVVLELELKLIADVGIIGLPNAGKSTLLSVVTSAKPKIADYPFTTTSPNLGVCEWKGERFVLSDIPGLIEDAHKGKGLGLEFLRHIERTKILLHIIDVSQGSLYKNFCIVQHELKCYSEKLAKKPMIIVLNKIDLLVENKIGKIVKSFKKKLSKKYDIVAISAVTKKGVNLLLDKIVELLSSVKEEVVEPEEETYKVYEYKPEIDVKKIGDKFVVEGEKIERIVQKTNFELEESVERLQKIFKKLGIEKLLKKKGIRPGDKVVIADVEFEYTE